MTELVPLRRNRDFMLFQTGQLLSAVGTAVASLAYPLLTLQLTHSPAKTGLVSFAAKGQPRQALSKWADVGETWANSTPTEAKG